MLCIVVNPALKLGFCDLKSMEHVKKGFSSFFAKFFDDFKVERAEAKILKTKKSLV